MSPEAETTTQVSRFSRLLATLKALPREIWATYKQAGFKGVYKRYGWKLLAGVFVYYLIRDVTLYIIIPYLAYRALTP